MTLKVLFVLKKLYPQCKIYFLSRSSSVSRIFTYIDYVDVIIPIFKDESYLAINFDIVLFVIKHNDLNMLVEASKIQTKRFITTFSKPLFLKMGFQYLWYKVGKNDTITKVINPYWRQEHIIIESSLNLVRSLDKKYYDSRIDTIDFAEARIGAGEENKSFIMQSLRIKSLSQRRKMVGISPFGRSSSRFNGNFTLQEWIEITQILADVYPEVDFILMDYPESKASFVDFTQNNIKVFKNNEDLLNLVALIQILDLLLSVNTANVHIADNLGIPTLEIIRQSESRKWAGGAYGGWYDCVVLPPNWQKNRETYQNLFLQKAKEKIAKILASKQILQT